MKKYVTLVLTVILVFAMNVAVFAAGSPKTQIDVDGQGNIGGTKVSVKVDNSTDDKIISKDAVDTTAANAAKAAVEQLGVVTKDENKKAVGTLVGAVVDVKLSDGVTAQPSEENPVVITFKVTGIKDDDVIIAAHQKHDGTWEYLKTETGEGKITVSFTSLSPVAFIKITTQEIPESEKETEAETEAEEEEEEEEEETKNSSSVSPKTGDYSAVLLGILAVSMAGIGICVKRAGKLE